MIKSYIRKYDNLKELIPMKTRATSEATEEQLKQFKLPESRRDSIQQDSEKSKQSEKFGIYAYYMFGIGLLLTWNVLLAANDFYVEFFPTADGYRFAFTILVAVSVPMLFVQLLAFFFLERIPY